MSSYNTSTNESPLKRRKQIWTEEEDLLLVKLIKKHGAKKWGKIASKMKNREGKQCRERWHNHLDPSIVKGSWADEEEWLLFLLFHLYPNRWSIISR